MIEPKEYKNYLELLIDLYPEDEFLIADGFDDAVIGVDYASTRLIYSCKKCIEILIEVEGMDTWGNRPRSGARTAMSYEKSRLSPRL